MKGRKRWDGERKGRGTKGIEGENKGSRVRLRTADDQREEGEAVEW